MNKKKNYYSRPTKGVVSIKNSINRRKSELCDDISPAMIKMIEEESDDRYKIITGISIYNCFNQLNGKSGATYLYNSN